MKNSRESLSRSDFVRSAIALPALAGLLAAATGVADAKGSKTQFKYQDTPKGKKQCSNCALFIPGKSATAAGTCKVVGGAISPHGYCIAYSPKST